jgi:isopentenyl-diphosphate delta-isomerase
MQVYPFRPHLRARRALLAGGAEREQAHWTGRTRGSGILESVPFGVVMPLPRRAGPIEPEPAVEPTPEQATAEPGELIVLVDDAGRPIGTAPKLASHHRDTPLHLAFSSYVFGSDGRFLLTRRALSKKTWPGIWTNSCCGHPGPGEPVEDAVRRRLADELGLTPVELVPLLPDFRYWAELDGVVENEICPVYGVRVDAEPTPNSAEVEAYRWVEWDALLAGEVDVELSPWCRLQLDLLAGHDWLGALPSGLLREAE